MTAEEFQTDVRQERHDVERTAQQRADDIVAARDDVVSAVRELRELEVNGAFYEDRVWVNSMERVRDITDRLNELEGVTS